jgi:ubiquinone/menaquinone biosynthesis C-methylase UbiE
MTHFDDKAATWDDDPGHVERAKVIARRLKKALGNKKIETAMEYGSGTGQLSFEMRDAIPKITLMDESAKMTEVTIQKCKKSGVSNLYPLKYDLLIDPLPEERFDLIFSLLTLHHIEELEMIFEKFKELLNPGGFLAIIDLEKEDGSFHDYEFHGHLGFDRKELEQIISAAGLKPLHYEVCYTIENEMEDGELREYPLFLLLAGKTI